MLSVQQFYARSRWRDQWNVLRPNGTRHRGHDVVCLTHEEIPALRGGTVVVNDHSGPLGHYTVVRVNATTYDYYCHLLVGSRPNEGVVIRAGDRVGRAAGWGDVHGSSWSGVHLHYGSGPAKTSVTTGPTYNATQIISATLGSLAGGGTSPLPGTPPIPAPPEEEPDMFKDNVKIIAVQGSATRGVIGAGVAHLFSGPTAWADFQHWCAVWDYETSHVDHTVAKQEHLESLIRIHQSNQNIADDEAKTLAAIHAINTAASGGGISDEDKAEILAAIDQTDENAVTTLLEALGLRQV